MLSLLASFYYLVSTSDTTDEEQGTLNIVQAQVKEHDVQLIFINGYSHVMSSVHIEDLCSKCTGEVTKEYALTPLGNKPVVK